MSETKHCVPGRQHRMPASAVALVGLPRLVLVYLAVAFAGTACTTTPLARTVRFDVEWIRSTLSKTDYGYRHAERTAPLIDGDVVFEGNGLDGLVAFEKESGHQLWRLDVRNGIESGFAVENNTLFFGASDGQFYAVNKANGKLIWTFPTRVENLATPLVTNGVVYFLAGNNVLYALDAKTGKQLWAYNRGDASSLSIRGGSRPTLFKGSLYVGFSDGYLAAVNSRDGTLIWERKLNNNLKFIDVDATPVVEENNIWVSSFDGALFCLSRTDGQILWRLDEGGSTPVSIVGDTLYFASLNENVYAIQKMTGVQKWKFNYEEKMGVPTQPIIYKGLVLVGASDGDLMAISELNGKLLARYHPGLGIFATPAVDEATGDVYAFSNEANLHVLHVAWKRPQDALEWK